MPHIHTQPNQHDMTVSAFVLVKRGDELKCLVHFHRKIQKLMQVGGHIELDETPWQSIAHELKEESGYELDELAVLQPTVDSLPEGHYVVHPVPFNVSTHKVSAGHYHSDLCYGFVATDYPKARPADGESSDLRWLTLEELRVAAEAEEALSDVYLIYQYLLGRLKQYVSIAAAGYSLAKPTVQEVIYHHGSPEGNDEAPGL